ncbi:hypothetical protein Tco_0503336 [Tanacetum coccineum]
MADNRTMAELLQAPTEGYEEAIVVPEIEAAKMSIKHRFLLTNWTRNKQFLPCIEQRGPHADNHPLLQ